MGEREFWEIIDLADWSREGDDEAVTEGMVRHLVSLSDEEIFAFDDALATGAACASRTERDCTGMSWRPGGFPRPTCTSSLSSMCP